MMHAGFPRKFAWKMEFASVSMMNRQMMYVHTFFIALTLLLMGILCLTSSQDLVTTSLGRRVLLGFAIFWFARLLIQFFGYSSELWRGKRFETIVHVVFSLIWSYFTSIFAIAAFG
jgi:hypothetical protein